MGRSETAIAERPSSRIGALSIVASRHAGGQRVISGGESAGNVE
jgi:hypothetical protein